jgi:hypothetical protein
MMVFMLRCDDMSHFAYPQTARLSAVQRGRVVADIAFMQLSAETYLQLVQALKSEPRRGREQRGKARVGIGGPLSIQLVEGAKLRAPVTVRLRDLSPEGIGITSAQALKSGTRFVVALPRLQGEALVLVCEVRHCDRVADGIYNVGAKFISDNTTDDRFGVGSSAKRLSDAILS